MSSESGASLLQWLGQVRKKSERLRRRTGRGGGRGQVICGARRMRRWAELTGTGLAAAMAGAPWQRRISNGRQVRWRVRD